MATLRSTKPTPMVQSGPSRRSLARAARLSRAGWLAPLLAFFLAPAAWAQRGTQEPPGALGQIAPPSTPAETTRSGQIGDMTRNVAAPGGTAIGGRDVQTPPQLARGGDVTAPSQLVREGRAVRGSPQLVSGRPSARSSTPLSRPKDGRKGAIARVVGEDRCDPEASGPARDGADCVAVIETRSADFPPPQVAPLSPEQRLLVEQRETRPHNVDPGMVSRIAGRRGGNDGLDAEAPEMQGIASVVLADGLAPPALAEPKGPTAGLAADQAAAVINVLAGVGIVTRP
ncbi:MAG: hypothetical protein JWM38_1828 [Sphingomonas bacterium]|nr:hypothetical protein [Sphingomonas bacterium]